MEKKLKVSRIALKKNLSWKVNAKFVCLFFSPFELKERACVGNHAGMNSDAVLAGVGSEFAGCDRCCVVHVFRYKNTVYKNTSLIFRQKLRTF